MAVRRSTPSTELAKPQPIQLPKLVTDPIAALDCWPVEVDLAGVTVVFPAMPAAIWLSVLMRPDVAVEEIFLDLLPESQAYSIDDAIMEGSLDFEELEDICHEVVGAVAARPWFVAMKLILLAAQSWDHLGGEMVFHGIDASRLSLAAWLDGLFRLILNSLPKDSMTMFLLKLEQPPEGYEDQVPEIEISRDQFMSLASD